jgi:membrane protease YdiL (CAAX protease family)
MQFEGLGIKTQAYMNTKLTPQDKRTMVLMIIGICLTLVNLPTEVTLGNPNGSYYYHSTSAPIGPIADALRHSGFYSLPTLNSCLWGLGIAAAVLILHFGMVRLVFNDLQFHRWSHWIMIPLTGIFGGLVEEPIFRGLLQTYIGLVPASLLFALAHSFEGNRNWKQLSLLVLPVGFLFGLGMLITGNLWTPIIAHFIANTCVSAKSYFSDAPVENEPS